MHMHTVTCIHDGIEVQKSTVKCEVKSGCKLIQKTGECCPEYQCGMFEMNDDIFIILCDISHSI